MSSLGYADALRRGSSKKDGRQPNRPAVQPQLPPKREGKEPRNPWQKKSGASVAVSGSAWGSSTTSVSDRPTLEKKRETRDSEAVMQNVVSRQSSSAPEKKATTPWNRQDALAPSTERAVARKVQIKAETSPDFHSSNDFPALAVPAPAVTPFSSPVKRKPQLQPDSEKVKRAQKKKKANNHAAIIVKKESPNKHAAPLQKNEAVATTQERQPLDHFHASNMLSFPSKKLPDEQRQGGGTELLSLAQQQGGSFSSGRQRIRPRKKKFTTLKKKVLQERLEQWKRLQEATNKQDPQVDKQADATEQMDIDHPEITPSFCTVCLQGFCTRDELQDDDERQELMDNLSSMATKVGPIRDVFFDPNDKGSDSPPAFVVFENGLDAKGAKACWDGIVLGGEKLQVRILNVTPDSKDKDESSRTKWRDAILDSYRESAFHSEQSVAQPHDSETRVVLGNVLSEEDFEDEDSLQESLGDIRTMVASCGAVVNVEVQRENSSVIVTFDTVENATRAVESFSGKVIGGQIVSAQRLLNNDLGDDHDKRKEKPCATIALVNFLTEDDFEDKDNLEECLGDIRKMAEGYGVVSDIGTPNDGNGTVLIAYNDLICAKQALEQFSGKVVGGQKVSATMYNEDDGLSSWIVLTNILTADDLEDEDCLEETKHDISELAGQYGQIIGLEVDGYLGGGQIRVQYSGGPSVASLAASKLDGILVGGQKASAKVLSNGKDDAGNMTPGSTIVAQIETDQEGKDTDEKQAPPLFAGDKLIPERFAECKRVPKVPNPVPGPRHYATLVDDEKVKPLLVEMLGELMRLQKRAVEDKNAKARRRIVMGLREVARGIRSHKVKMVIMANNLDQYGVIDEKLQGILDLARQEDVPVFFEFSKRTLGKAVGKKVKVSVVGIQNAEGAHYQFKKVASLAPSHAVATS